MYSWKRALLTMGLSAVMVTPSFTAVSAQDGSFTVKKSSIDSLRFSQFGMTGKENLYKNNKKSQLSETVLLVKYKKILSSSDHKKAGTSLVRRISSLGYDVVKLNKGKKMEDVTAAYAKMSSVTGVSPSANFVKLGTPDPKLNEQYHLSLLNISKAQSLAGKNKVRVAVIDSGIDSKHPELKNKLLPSYNMVNPMNPGAPDFHGTHVAGIIASEKNNGIGGAGINPNVEILPIDVFDRGWGASDYVIAEAIMHAIEKKAKIINMSLGSIYPSPLIEDAVNKALAANITFIAAAGNDGMDLKNYPASFEGVISVGSTNKDNELSTYSSFGPSVDIVAPGEAIYAPLYDYEKKSTFVKMSGTSMATPVVSGVASLLLSKYPNLTPKQVEYILEQSSKDLGKKGFDTKFANGLVDPVKALQYDVSKIPSSINLKKTRSNLLNKAEKVNLSSKLVKSDAIKLPYEEKMIQFNVKAGEYIQTTLSGSEDYDYKYSLYLVDHRWVPEKIEINKVQEGQTEGHLYRVPRSGVLVVVVSDVNGNYNKDGNSRYTLNVEKFESLIEDTNTRENPAAVNSLPFKQVEGDVTFTAQDSEGDSDYYTFKSDKQQIVKFAASGVAGVDSALGLYVFEQIPEEEMPEGEDFGPIENLMEIVNSKPAGQGEQLTFEAMPDVEYMIEINNHTPGFFFPDILFNGLNFDFPSSHLPYQVTMDSKELPEDEDGFPMGGDLEEEYMEEDMDLEEYVAKKNESRRNFHDMLMGEEEYEEDMLPLIREAALPYELGWDAEGYLQYNGDEDWYSITPENSGIFEMNFGESAPAIEIYKVVQFEEMEELMPVASNLMMGMNDIETKSTLSAGLRAGDEYYLRVVNPNYQPSLDPYQISSQLSVEAPEDEYENNDNFRTEPVEDMADETVIGNYAMTGDVDAYYVTAEQNGIYGVNYDPIPASKELKAKYPKELLKPIDGVVVIVDDKNDNRILDPEELGNVRVIDKGWDDEPEQGSFKAQKGKGYFVIADQWSFEGAVSNLNEYKLTVKPVNTNDEDKTSVVKNNIPSKPLTLKNKSKKEWEGTGYLNPGVTNGDADWYKFNAAGSYTGQIILTNAQIDGVISLYDSKGKLVATSDLYRIGDAEVLNFSVNKGNYFIKVTDAFGNASLTPYSLKVKIN